MPRGSSGQTNSIKSCDNESREVVRPRRVQEEWDSGSNAVPYTLTFWRTGWREERTTEGPHRWQHYIKNCDEELRQVFHARRVQEEMDAGYHAMPFTLTIWGKGWWQEYQATLKPERDREPKRDREPERDQEPDRDREEDPNDKLDKQVQVQFLVLVMVCNLSWSLNC